MEVSRTNHEEKEKFMQTQLQKFEIESFNEQNRHHFHSTNALEILRETVRILRYNLTSFMLTAALLICPVSAIVLPDLLVNQSVVKKLNLKLLLVAESSGLPLRPFIKQTCLEFAETAVSSSMCFPLFITLSLLSKAAVAYSVDCTYLGKKAELRKLLGLIRKIWTQVVFTYIWVCMIVVGCLMSFCVLLIAICSSFSVLGFSPDFNFYFAIPLSLGFAIVFANAIIICSMAIVGSVLEDDVFGPRALIRARDLIKGKTQVGLTIFLGSTIGAAFVRGLFEHRVKTLSYGDGSSRIWEGPLLVLMYSFVVLIDSMMISVFYFSCRTSRTEAAEGSTSEGLPVLETSFVVSVGSVDFR